MDEVFWVVDGRDSPLFPVYSKKLCTLITIDIVEFMFL